MNDQQVDVAFETLPNDVFEQLMGDAPPQNQPNADTLPGGGKPEDKTEPAKARAAKPSNQEPEPEPVKEKTQEEIDAEIEAAAAGDAEPKANTEGDDSPIDLAEFFKTKAEGLIARGIWEEFEDMDKFEWNEENYGKLAETQAQWKAEAMYEEKVGKTGDIGKAIIEYVENGGDPNEIVDLFKASRRIENFDIKTSEGMENIVREYYSKVVGWSEAKTDKYVKGLIDSGDERLKEEATEAKDLMDKGIQDQIKRTQEDQKQAQIKREQQAKAWENNMKEVIKGREDLTPGERKDVEQALLAYNQKLPDGRVVNKFMVKFIELQADPKKYVDLVRFVMDPERYDKKIDKQASTATAKKNWDFIKGNSSLSRSTSTSHSKLQEKPKNDLVLDYKKLMQ